MDITGQLVYQTDRLLETKNGSLTVHHFIYVNNNYNVLKTKKLKCTLAVKLPIPKTLLVIRILADGK